MLHVQAENVWWRIPDHINIIWPILVPTLVFLVVPEYVISGDGLSGSEEKMQREVAPRSPERCTHQRPSDVTVWLPTSGEHMCWRQRLVSISEPFIDLDIIYGNWNSLTPKILLSW